MSLPEVQGFELQRTLGQGGMGTVYLARDIAQDRLVALKLLSNSEAATPLERLRFKREFHTLEKFTHPALVRVYSYGESGDWQYFTMEYIEGQDLRSAVQKIRQTQDWLPRVLNALEALILALEYIHAQGVIHRDLKPQNALMDAHDQVRLLDFGLARQLGGQQITETGVVMGTLYYMSPEQLRGEELDARSDLFSLGLILYELLAGRYPFKGTTVIQQIMKGTAPPLEDSLDAPPALSRLIHQLLEKDRDKRPTSSKQVARQWADLVGSRPGQASSSTGIPAIPNISTLVGRQAVLARAWEVLAEDRPLFITGPSGVGRTRILQEIQRGHPGRVMWSRGSELERLPYQVFLPLLRQAAQMGLSADVQPFAEALAVLLPEVGPSTAGFTADDPMLKLKLFEGMSRLLRQGEEDTILLLDDLHWADESSLEFLSHLLAKPASIRRLGLVLSSTHNLERTWERHGVVRLELENLTLEETRKLVEANFATRERWREMWEKTQGNPLFLLELLKSPDGQGLPSNVSDAAGRRLDGLEASVVRIAQVVALLGQGGDFALLQGLLEDDPEALLDALELLRRRRVLREIDHRQGTYGAECEVVREVLLQRLSSSHRRHWHSKIGVALEGRPDAVEAAGYHFDQAGDSLKASRLYALAGQRKARAYAYAEAVRLFEQAAELDPQRAVELAEPLADAQAGSQHHQQAQAAYRKLLVEQPGTVRLRRKLALSLYAEGRLQESLDELLGLMEDIGVRLSSWKQKLNLIGRLLSLRPPKPLEGEHLPEFHLAAAALARCFLLVRPPGWMADHTTLSLLHHSALGGSGDQAQQAQSLHMKGLRLLALAGTKNLLEARRHFSQAISIVRQLPPTPFKAELLRDSSFLLYQVGDVSGLGAGDESIELAYSLGELSNVPLACAVMAMCCTVCGRLTEARAHVERLETFGATSGDRTVAALVPMTQTMLAARLGQGELAQTCLEQFQASLLDCPAGFFQHIMLAEVVWVWLARNQPQRALEAVRTLLALPWMAEEINRFGDLEARALELEAMLLLRPLPPPKEFTLRFAAFKKRIGVFVLFETWSHVLQGRYCQALGQAGAATQHFQQALKLGTRAQFPLSHGQALQGLAELGHGPAAQQLLAQSQACFAEAGWSGPDPLTICFSPST